MADRLEQHLVNIEKDLGGDGKLPKNYDQIDKLEWHLDKIEDLLEGGTGGGSVDDVKVNGESVVEDKIANINLKTINNESIAGDGNINIPAGSEVVANPTLAGTEATLEGLQVGDTKYAVPQGGGGEDSIDGVYYGELEIEFETGEGSLYTQLDFAEVLEAILEEKLKKDVLLNLQIWDIPTYNTSNVLMKVKSLYGPEEGEENYSLTLEDVNSLRTIDMILETTEEPGAYNVIECTQTFTQRQYNITERDIDIDNTAIKEGELLDRIHAYEPLLTIDGELLNDLIETERPGPTDTWFQGPVALVFNGKYILPYKQEGYVYSFQTYDFRMTDVRGIKGQGTFTLMEPSHEYRVWYQEIESNN